jgi:TonB-dependent SusC/RagA subfamily outer membrane receptor
LLDRQPQDAEDTQMDATFSRATTRSLGTILLLGATAACAGAGAPKTEPASTTPSPRVGTSSDATLQGGTHTQTYSSIVELIQARAPGLQVIRAGDSYALRIRGLSSPSGITDPLIVIDGAASGLPGTRALDAINPNDVLKIEVLKDAASTAFYGLRGGSGVILVTTRKK